MESWVPLTPAASEAWQAIQENSTIDYGFMLFLSWKKEIRKVLDAWREESPGEFQAWKEAVEEACRQNTVLKTWRAAYSEIENLEQRVLDLDRSISPAVTVGSSWEAVMNFQLLTYFDSLLDKAKSEALTKAERVQKLFREAEQSLPFFPTRTLIHEIYPEEFGA
ncbi:unnamed protein product [Sphagnum balticum]